MTLDFSGVRGGIVVGYQFDIVEKRPVRRAVAFEEAVLPYAAVNPTRWEAYANMRDHVKSIDEKQRNRRGIDFELDAKDALRKEVLTKTMQLIADVYLSKGFIHNEPIPKKEVR